MSSFAAQVERFFAEFFELDPLSATAAGMHLHDARWPDLTEAGRLARVAFAQRWQAVVRRDSGGRPGPG